MAWAGYGAEKLTGSTQGREAILPVKEDTMENYVSAIRSYHIDRGLTTKVFDSKRQKRIIRGASAFKNQTRKPRLPITRLILVSICEDILTNLIDLNLRAAWLLAFTALLRIGEIIFSASGAADNEWFFKEKVTHSCLRFSPNLDHMTMHLKASKTDKKKQGVSIVIAAVDGPLCAVKAIWQLF
jgi:hypothetical protein